MQLVIAVPQLLALPPEAFAPCPAFSRLARYGGASELFADGFDAALLAALRLPKDTPVAPLAALGAGFDPGNALVMRADPVTLVAGRDDVRVAGRVDDLSAAETRSLMAALDRHFRDDGIAFHAPRPDAWFITSTANGAPLTSALPGITGAIHGQFPRGDRSAAWRRWLSEMQMLLHADAVNLAREEAGLVPANGIWISGAGHRSDVGPIRATVYASPERTGDVARGLARLGGGDATAPPAQFASLPASKQVAVVLSAVGDDDLLRAFDSAWLAPAVAALESAQLHSLALVADADGGPAQIWRAAPPPWHARLAARLSPAPFIPTAREVRS